MRTHGRSEAGTAGKATTLSSTITSGRSSSKISAPRSRSTRPIPTQLFVGPYAPSGKNAIVGPATARGAYSSERDRPSGAVLPVAPVLQAVIGSEGWARAAEPLLFIFFFRQSSKRPSSVRVRLSPCRRQRHRPSRRGLGSFISRSRRTSASFSACGVSRSRQGPGLSCPPASPRPRALREREDVEQLDVEPVRGQRRDLRDAVSLLEAQHELLAGVVGGFELLQPEAQRGGLLPGHEQELRLDVVRAPEVV